MVAAFAGAVPWLVPLVVVVADGVETLARCKVHSKLKHWLPEQQSYWIQRWERARERALSGDDQDEDIGLLALTHDKWRIREATGQGKGARVLRSLAFGGARWLVLVELVATAMVGAGGLWWVPVVYGGLNLMDLFYRLPHLVDALLPKLTPGVPSLITPGGGGDQQ